jgi:DNA-directed RNA polymerase specialized sigma24 family protein
VEEQGDGADHERDRRESDAELLAAVRRNDVRALRELAKRLDPILLDQARRLGVSESDRRIVVTEFLDDILVKLARSPTPRSLISFVIASFRNSVTDQHREAVARERFARSQEESVGVERTAGAGCSEFMLRAAQGPDVADEPSSQPSIELVRVLFEHCSTDDRQLLVWSTHRVPLRDCAAWLGISYDSAKQRLSRLRSRLLRESVTHLSELSEPDRAELARLLRKVGMKVDNDKTRGSAA